MTGLAKTPYIFASHAVVASEKTYAVTGSKVTQNVTKRTANAPIFLCKAAERINFGWAISSPLINLHQSLDKSGYGALRLNSHF